LPVTTGHPSLRPLQPIGSMSEILIPPWGARIP
jgi:hypothetical protein